VGRDERGRKQYRYHPRYRLVRDENKFERMAAFAHALPKIRRRVRRDLQLPGLPKRKVLAAAVRLLEVTFVRVGNQEYAKNNQSFGLTTLRDRHVQIFGHKVFFRFRGKSKQTIEVELNDRGLANIIKRCRDLPGYELFQYIDDDGNRASIGSEDVNDYLREIAGQDFTAKDFRTWAGTIAAAETLAAMEACQSATSVKKNVVEAVKQVSRRLGNRPATCRKYYIHPAIFDAYLTGVLAGSIDPQKSPPNGKFRAALTPQERCVLELLVTKM
jgi:DNA topoisomerase-1